MISVVICTHNRSELLARTLETLAAVDVPVGVRWEVCVVDNASTDDTPAVVEAYARRYPAFPVRRVVEPCAGVAFARNAGVEAARGEVIAFVDDDVTVTPTWLGVIASAFAGDPELAILGGCLRANPESPMPEWLTNINTAPLGLIDYGAPRRRIDFPYLATANCAFRKAAIREAGMFDVRLGRTPTKLYADEDTEMVARILKLGGKVEYEPSLLGFHFIPNRRLTKEYFRRWYWERGEGVGLVGSGGDGRSLLGVALYEYRALLVNVGKFVRHHATGRPTFQEELYIGYFGGIVAGRLKSRRARGAAPSPA